MSCTTCKGEGIVSARTPLGVAFRRFLDDLRPVSDCCPRCKGTNDPGSYGALLRQALDRAEEENPGYTRDLLLDVMEMYFGQLGERTDRQLDDSIIGPLSEQSGADVCDQLALLLDGFDPDSLKAPVVVDFENCEECREIIPEVHGGSLLSRYHRESCSLHDPAAR